MFKKLLFLFAVCFVANSAILASSKSEKPVKIDASNYQQEISNGVVLVEYWAVWCGPCRKLAPVLNEMAKDKELDIKIAKINVDNNKSFALSKGVKTIPTMILYKDGKEVSRFSGFYAKDELVEKIAKALK